MQASLFDRLTDEHPKLSREPYVSPYEEMRQLRASVCRDLTDLLNTKRREEAIDPAFEHVRNSIENLGVPDFLSMKLANPSDRELIRTAIEAAIRRYEPRLTKVSVQVDAPNSVHPILRFRVDAMLRTNPAEPVQFDAVLFGDSRRFRVSGESE
jgi:type VI secretion system protein ImpF